MRKPKNEKIERNGLRLLAVVSLAFTLTAFGCTMNRMRGNGQSTEQTPEIGPANSSSAPGSSSAATNPPMASGAIVVDPTSPAAVTAQATLVADQGYGGRVLGVTNPPTNTQVSSSVSSAVTAPRTSGAGVAVEMTPVTTVAMSGNATDVGTLATPANSAIAATTPVTDVSSQAALPTAPTATTSLSTSTSTTATTAKTTTTSKAKSAKATVKASPTKVAQPIQIQTTASGDVVMTNTTTNPPQQR